MRRQKRFETRARAQRCAMMHRSRMPTFVPHGVDRNLLMTRAGCDWIRKHQSLLVTGPAGVGKSWLACARGHKVCREDFSVAYTGFPGCSPRTCKG
ncbi:ATP-binding protein [Rhizobium grahamii]|uniref:ATP-binding protein n=1 Tax=Rhizobium grahamii TaxID=1120045 RepID=UPI0026D8D87C